MSTLADINFNHLYYFHVVAGAGSLAKASEELGVAQSTISEQLKQLEGHFQTKLFVREPSGMRLNTEGKRMLRYTKIMFRAGQRLLLSFDDGFVDEKIIIDVGVSSSVSRSLAAEYFTPLFQDPELLVRVKHGDYDYLLHDLVSRQLDIIVSDQKPSLPRHAGLVVDPIVRSALILVRATASEVLERLFAEDPLRVPFLNFSANSRYRWEVDQHLRKAGLSFNMIGEVDDVLIMRAAVEEGVCIAALPEPVVSNDLKTKRFIAIDRIEPTEAGVYASYHKKDPSDYVLAIVKRLRAENKV